MGFDEWTTTDDPGLDNLELETCMNRRAKETMPSRLEMMALLWMGYNIWLRVNVQEQWKGYYLIFVYLFDRDVFLVLASWRILVFCLGQQIM